MADDIIRDAAEGIEDDGIIVLEDDLGNEVEFEYLDVIEYEGEEYLLLLPADDEEADEVLILKIECDDDENENFVGIDDEELLDKVFALFKDKWKDEIDFE